jgi:death on curing protein
MTEVSYLTLEDLLDIAQMLDAQVRDPGLLDSSAYRPRSGMFGQDAYPTIWLKAAALMQSIDHNQALLDGNKRLSWIAALVFLRRNGYRIDTDVDSAFALCMAVASGESLEKIAATLQRWAVPS